MPNYESIAHSLNEKEVLYDPINSHAATHLEDTLQLAGLVREAIGKMVLLADEIATDVDMGRQVGTCDVVKVDDSDKIVYAIRKNRLDDGYVPFTKSRQGEPSRHIALHLIKQNEQAYILSSTWIGTYDNGDEPFPQSLNATERSIPFWQAHAFVWGSQAIRAGTLRRQRPW